MNTSRRCFVAFCDSGIVYKSHELLTYLLTYLETWAEVNGKVHDGMRHFLNRSICGNAAEPYVEMTIEMNKSAVIVTDKLVY